MKSPKNSEAGLQKQTQSLQKTAGKSFAIILRAKDNRELTKYVSSLSETKIRTDLKKRRLLEEQKESLRSQWRYWKQRQIAANSEEKEKINGFLESIETAGMELKSQLDGIEVYTVRELSEADESQTEKDIALLVLDVSDFFKVHQSLSGKEILELSTLILNTHGSLTLEDIAICFNTAKQGDYGKIEYALDGGHILKWLATYQAKRQQAIQAENQSVHASSKGESRHGEARSGTPVQKREDFWKDWKEKYGE